MKYYIKGVEVASLKAPFSTDMRCASQTVLQHSCMTKGKEIVGGLVLSNRMIVSPRLGRGHIKVEFTNNTEATGYCRYQSGEFGWYAVKAMPAVPPLLYEKSVRNGQFLFFLSGKEIKVLEANINCKANIVDSGTIAYGMPVFNRNGLFVGIIEQQRSRTFLIRRTVQIPS